MRDVADVSDARMCVNAGVDCVCVGCEAAPAAVCLFGLLITLACSVALDKY